MSVAKQKRTSDVTERFSLSPQNLKKNNVWGKLTLCNGDGSKFPNTIDLKGNDISFGRNKTCDICLKTNQISGDHGKIQKSNDENGNELIQFIDQSTNGTWINKVHVWKSKLLITDGDEIKFVPASQRRNRKEVAYILIIFDADKNAGSAAYESKYIITGKLGDGAYADVFEVIDRVTLSKYAMKCIDKSKWKSYQNCTKRKITLLDEVHMMSKMNHPGIIKMEEYFEDDDQVYIILEICKGGDLLGFISQKGMGFEEKVAADLFMQLVMAVNYVHSVHGIAHRDLKPDNILLNKDASILKLSDFGTSRPVATNEKCETIVGTKLYLAPEVNTNVSASVNSNNEASNDDDDDDYDDDRYDGKIADYWSLGVILYIIILGCPPASKQESIIEDVSDNKIKWYGENVSKAAQALIYGLLNLDPQRRMKYNDIIKHEWIKKNWSLYDQYSNNRTTKNNDVNDNNNDNDDEKSSIIMETDNSNQNKKRTRNEIELQSNNECMDDVIVAEPKNKKYKIDPKLMKLKY